MMGSGTVSMARSGTGLRGVWHALTLAVALPGAVVAPFPAHAAAPSTGVTLPEEVRALRGTELGVDPAAALRHIDDVLARAARDRSIDAVDLLYAKAVRASALSTLDRSEEALRQFTEVEAELTRRQVPLNPERASLLLHIGSELGSLGKLDEAAAYTARALDLAQRTAGKDSPEYAEALYGLALLDYQRGRQNEAIPKLVEALGIARAQASHTGENLEAPAEYGITLAALQLNVSDAETAVVTAREAADWAEQHLPADHRVRVAAAQQLGAILSEAGLYAQAIPILRGTLDKRLAILPPDHPQVAMSFHALAFALDNAGMRAEAKPLYDRAVAIFSANPDKLQAKGLSTMIGQQARMAMWEGDGSHALALRRQALEVARKASATPDDQVVLTAELNLAATLIDLSRVDEAAPLLDHARAGFLAGTSALNKRRVTAATLTARIGAVRGDAKTAETTLRQDLAPLRSRLLDRATSRKDVLAMLSEFRQPFLTLARLGIATGRTADAFDALQMANIGDLQGAFSSLAMLQNDYGPEAREAIRAYLALSAQSRQLRKSLDQALAAGVSASDEGTRAVLDGQIAEVDAKLREADATLGRLVPGYAALTAVEPARLADTQKRLAHGQGVVLIGADDQGLVTLLVTRDAVAVGTADIAARRLLELTRALRGSIDAGLIDNGAAYDRAAAYALYQLIFPASVRPLLRRVTELQVLAPGNLATVPFAALVSRPPHGSDADPQALRKTRWLMRDHAVRILVSAAPLPVRSRLREDTRSFAGIGAPVLGAPDAAAMRSGDLRSAALARLGSLPGAETELRNMARAFRGDSQLLLGPNATETAVRHAPLERARVLAFATHGLVGGALRGVVEPALVLSAPAVPSIGDDGLLTASEVAQLRLDADWVILSACDTGAGESENAPTYSGLARAFIAAGSRALLLSHWPVRDDVAGRLTLRTLEGARGGLPRAEALRRAQLDLMKDASVDGSAHPASWAPFVLVGG